MERDGSQDSLDRNREILKDGSRKSPLLGLKNRSLSIKQQTFTFSHDQQYQELKIED